MSGEEPIEEGRAGPAYVEITGWGGGEANADGRIHKECERVQILREWSESKREGGVGDRGFGGGRKSFRLGDDLDRYEHKTRVEGLLGGTAPQRGPCSCFRKF